ncbi:hypothetical protein [Paenibacillus rhizoplanae]|uniref:ABC-2 family transporter protein n=1 Tax=Paenibacillus rhizoplanae TaxID=1917181 RepID=A0ABW5F472_9BACL
MSRFSFFCCFTIYTAISGIIFLFKVTNGHNWFDQWIYDRFFVFQFISVVTIGLNFEASNLNDFSYVRLDNRRKILARELLGYYIQGFICLSVMFIFIIFGALLLVENNFIMKLADWYFRYLLGIVLFINVISCLKWSNKMTLRKYCFLIVFMWMALELIVLRSYIRKFFGLDINLLFSWVFQKGIESYFWMLGMVLISIILNIMISDKKDFI